MQTAANSGIPRIVLGLLGIDQHEVGAIAVTGLLRDAGMEVVYVGRFNTPETFVRAVMDEDAEIIGISCHSWEYLHFVPELMGRIASEALDVAVVLGGSVITPSDAQAMLMAGVAAVFGPDAAREQIVEEIRMLSEAVRRRKRASSLNRVVVRVGDTQ